MVTAVLILGAWLASYLTFRALLRRSLNQLRGELRAHIASLSANAKPGMHFAAASTTETTTKAATPVFHAVAPVARPVRTPAEASADDVSPEAMAHITETVNEFLGCNARVRSVKMLRSTGSNPSAWAQQGRLAVHTSHNLPSGRSV